jgi:hypothetical protein
MRKKHAGLFLFGVILFFLPLILGESWAQNPPTMLVVVRAEDDSLWKMTCDEAACSSFISFPGMFRQQPAVTWDEKAQEWVVIGMASDDSIWMGTFDKDGNFNNDWQPVPGRTPSPVGTSGSFYTLGSLNCASGQIPKWNGSGWACAADEGGSGVSPSSTVANLDGTSSAGASINYSRGDHKHGMPAGSISTAMIANGAVSTAKIGDDQVTDAKIAGPITGSKISSVGLDADTLDGQHAAGFAVSSHHHDGLYYSKSHVDALEARIASLETALSTLQTLVRHFTRSGNDIYLTGANLHIRSGSGATDGAINGIGNLIVGYNEAYGPQDRNGSHNIVVGPYHHFASYGGIVVGHSNMISAPYASVSGGNGNAAVGDYSSVSGGTINVASGESASVSGGSFNTASAYSSSVSGGGSNISSGDFSSVSGGASNRASGSSSSVAGGDSNRAFADNSTVFGGSNNISGDPNLTDPLIGLGAAILGGFSNLASGYYASVMGGASNHASGESAVVTGGYSNTASNSNSSVSGGEWNTASGDRSSVTGGSHNTASWHYTSVSGGERNTASGTSSSVSGGADRSVTGSGDWRGGEYFSDN